MSEIPSFEKTYTEQLIDRYAYAFHLKESVQVSRKRNAKLLQRKQELDALERYDAEYQKICHELLNGLLYFVMQRVKRCMRRYNIQHLDQDDLFNEGCIGALEGIKRHNGTTTLATYCGYWIDHAIKKHIQERERAISVPLNVQQMIVWLGKIERDLLMGRTISECSLEEIRDLFAQKYPDKKIPTLASVERALWASSLATHSLGAISTHTAKHYTKMLEDNEDWNIFLRQVRDAIHATFEKSERNVHIWKEYYVHNKSASAISAQVGLTTSRVQQIIAEGIEGVRKRMHDWDIPS